MKGCFVEQNTELKDIQRCIRSDVPEPKADIEADQVLVDVRSAGLNFCEFQQVRSLLGDFIDSCPMMKS